MGASPCNASNTGLVLCSHALTSVQGMHSSGDSDFEPLPVPAKRRRTVLDDDAAGDENAGPETPARNKRPKKSLAEQPIPKPKAKKEPKPRHRIRIHHGTPDVEDQILSQAGQDIPSSPWRLRGAMWYRPDQEPSPCAATEPEPVADVNTVGHDDKNFGPDDLFDDDDFDFDPDDSVLHVTNPSAIGASNAPAKLPIPEVLPRAPPPRETSETPSRLPQPDRVPDTAIDLELAELPSDAFESPSSSPGKPDDRRGENAIWVSSQTSPAKRIRVSGPQQGARQMTLFGQTAQGVEPAIQASMRHNWPLAKKDEPPTHHKIEVEAMKTWVYPTNLGTIRDYQYNIVARGLFHNLLVALPTGLGKTFIAATVMLNWFRWTKDAQIVFVAPTKPLVSQQVDACFKIAGIPRSQTTMLTGGISPGVRAEEWAQKRVFFMTPQTLHNDLRTGIADPKRIVLLVVDEAHRATGNYAYVEVNKLMRRFNQSFRILALTATPGSKVESVQEVISNLSIARIEIRTEFSLDIRQYVHSKNTESQVFDNSEEMVMIMEWFSKAVQPVLDKLAPFNAYWSRDPLQLTPYGLTIARQKWARSDGARSASPAAKAMVMRIFSVLASLAHGVELLKYHGVGPFFHCMQGFQNANTRDKGNKYERQILDSDAFTKMMTRLRFWMNNDSFVGHPKLEYLQGTVLRHFTDAGEAGGRTAGIDVRPTRVMIFAHYRDSAEEIVRVLNRNSPMIRPHVFIGQAASKGSEGMDQKRQLEIIKQFKEGTFNTLVATSIGEEGLDIGEIDLIICYDSSASPIRMLQRMGRTGRKRAGNIVLLLMRGKEERSYAEAKDNYAKMQHLISEGTQFSFREDESRRIVPRDIQSLADKRVVDIPVENTQIDALPEPGAKKGKRAPKRPAKKFHMPDNVRTGFVRASRLDGNSDSEGEDDFDVAPKRQRRQQTKGPVAAPLEPIPPLADVVLSKMEEELFERRYVHVSEGVDEEVHAPRAGLFPERQRSLGKAIFVRHGKATASVVRTMQNLDKTDQSRVTRIESFAKDLDLNVLCGPDRSISSTTTSKPPQKGKGTAAARKAATKPANLPNLKKAAPQPRAPAKRKRPVHHDSLDAVEGTSSSPPPTDPRMAFASQGISLGSSDTEGGGGADEDQEMDSELEGFIAGSDEEDEAAPDLTSEPEDFWTHGASRRASGRGGRNDYGDEDEDDSNLLRGLRSDDESDDDLPSLSQVARRPVAKEVGGVCGQQRRRRVVEDDSDEDDDDE